MSGGSPLSSAATPAQHTRLPGGAGLEPAEESCGAGVKTVKRKLASNQISPPLVWQYNCSNIKSNGAYSVLVVNPSPTTGMIVYNCQGGP